MMPCVSRSCFTEKVPSNSDVDHNSGQESPQRYYNLTPVEEIHEGRDDYLVPGPVNHDAEPLIAIIGVGYIGEVLVSVFARVYDVLGYDVSETRTRHLGEKFSDCTRVRFTTCPEGLAKATHFLICVPTLLLPDKTIDSSFIRSALGVIEKYAGRGAVVVVESSVAVGMTRQLLGRLAKERGWFAGMSPERVDPGRVEPDAYAIPKVVSGLDDVVPGSLHAVVRLYSAAFSQVIPVSCPEAAEMMKLYENCQRMVCIAYANEMADACRSHNIDPFEVCRAASTKPFGYMPITPSLGVGGHCIPVNPYYLFSNSQFPLLRTASEKMRSRPAAIAQRAVDKLYSEPRSRLPPRILVVGIGFKPGQAHLANSPGLELSKALVLTDKVDVSWADPLITQEAVPQISRLDARKWTVESLEESFDMVIVALRQHGLDFSVLDKVRGVAIELWCP